MPEDQLTALPPEVRQMVMTGATTMMSGGGPNTMMGPAVGMNSLMDMNAMNTMNAMNMGAMGLGMNGEMAMQMQPSGPMMQDVPLPGPGGPGGPSGTAEQNIQMGMSDGFNTGGPGAGGMMGMGMAGDFGMQVGVFCWWGGV
jgi:pre-mRNA 3'-end-processing factor FIP1